MTGSVSQALAYQAPWWLPGGHLQTVVPARMSRLPAVNYRRERWDTPDGDFIDVDFAEPDDSCPQDNPCVVLFHGLEGNSASHYALAMMHAVRAQGWFGMVPHFRGCSGETNRLLRCYHAGDADEIDWIVKQVRERYPLRPLFLIGVSLGGNAMLRWLGEQREEAAALVKAAVGVSVPMDLEASAYALSSGFNKRYTEAFLATLIPKALAKIEQFPGAADYNAVRRSKSFFDFDGLVTGPFHGFANAHDYWRKSSSGPLLKHVHVPSLVINAKNDPFMPAHFLPTRGAVSSDVTLFYPETGGHAGFPTPRGWLAGVDWLPKTALAFFGRVVSS